HTFAADEMKRSDPSAIGVERCDRLTLRRIREILDRRDDVPHRLLQIWFEVAVADDALVGIEVYQDDRPVAKETYLGNNRASQWHDHGPCADALQRQAILRHQATFSAHTASPQPPSRAPAGSRASSRHASIAPRTTSAHGPLAWGARRTRTHRSIPAPPTPAGASRLPRTVPCPTPASAAERPSPDLRVRAPRSNRPDPGCSTRRTSLRRRSSGRTVPSNQALLPSAPSTETLPPSFRKSPGQRGGHPPFRGS